MESTNITVLVVPVPQAVYIQPFRNKHLHRPGVTMPPHVTLHAPFKLAGDIHQDVLDRLSQLLGSYAPFRFILARTARFSETGVLYLAPEPAEPFLVLARAIRTHFPEVPSDHPYPVMHLTLALVNPNDLDNLDEEFQSEYGNRLPLETTAAEVSLYERRGNSWTMHTSFALSGS